MNLIFQLLYFLIPAAVANMAPVFVKNRLLGDHKTFRGLVAAIIGAMIVIYLQLILYDFKFFRDLSLIDYSQINFLILGFLIGFGVMFGDAVGSFIKRRFNTAPGKSLLFIDQINGALGLAIFVMPFYLKSWKLFFYILIIWTLGHFIFKFLGYLL